MKALIILISFLTVIGLDAQDVISLDNVNCTGNSLSFDLTITNGGTPVNINNSNTFILEDEMNNSFFSSAFDPTTCCSGDNVPIDNIPINGTLSSGTCADVIGTNVTFNGFSSTSPSTASIPNFAAGSATSGPTADPIPTLGEWAFILLSLVILTVGMISLRAKYTTNPAI